MAKLKPSEILNQAITAQLERFAQMSNCRLAFCAPVQIISEANGQHGHWRTKYRRKQAQQLCVNVCWASEARSRTITPPYIVHLHRIGPRELDDDNLGVGFKAVRDAIAKQLGVDDGNKEAVKFQYTQEALGARQYAIVVAVQELKRKDVSNG